MRRRGDEYDQGRELGRPEDLKRLRLDVQYGDLAFLVDFPDRVQLRAVHSVVVGAYLTPVRRVCRSARSRPKTAETAANDSAERRDTNGLKGQRRARGEKQKASVYISPRGTRHERSSTTWPRKRSERFTSLTSQTLRFVDSATVSQNGKSRLFPRTKISDTRKRRSVNPVVHYLDRPYF